MSQTKIQQAGIALRPPRAEDGSALNALVAASPPLDTNSCYCNLLQCSHFSATSVLAERAALFTPTASTSTVATSKTASSEAASSELVGAVTGYRLPDATDVLFIWQVVVSERARGLGLAKAMLLELVNRCAASGCHRLETTITRDNTASWALFRSLAQALDADLEHQLHFDAEQHFAGNHPSEYLVRIGPIRATSGDSASRTAPPHHGGVPSNRKVPNKTNGEAA